MPPLDDRFPSLLPEPVSEDGELEVDLNAPDKDSSAGNSPGVSPIASPIIILGSEEDNALHPSLLGSTTRTVTSPQVKPEPAPELPPSAFPASTSEPTAFLQGLPLPVAPHMQSQNNFINYRVNIAPPVAEVPEAPSLRSSQAVPRSVGCKSTAGVCKPPTYVPAPAPIPPRDLTFAVSNCFVFVIVLFVCLFFSFGPMCIRVRIYDYEPACLPQQSNLGNHLIM